MDLEAIRKQADEDERVAQATPEGGRPWHVKEATGLAGVQCYVSAVDPAWTPNPLSSYSNLGIWTSEGLTTKAIAEHVARHSPARVLADVAERRALCDEIERMQKLLNKEES